MKVRRTAGAVLAACTLGLVLTGCGGGSNSHADSGAKSSASASSSPSGASSSSSDSSGIDSSKLATFVESLQSYVPKIKKQYSSSYSDITITGSGSSTLVYTYTYKRNIPGAVAKTAINKTKSKLQKVCDDQVFPSMKQSGISDPEVKYVYLNKNGSTIWTHTFTPSSQ